MSLALTLLWSLVSSSLYSVHLSFVLDLFAYLSSAILSIFLLVCRSFCRHVLLVFCLFVQCSVCISVHLSFFLCTVQCVLLSSFLSVGPIVRLFICTLVCVCIFQSVSQHCLPSDCVESPWVAPLSDDEGGQGGQEVNDYTQSTVIAREEGWPRMEICVNRIRQVLVL